MFLLAFLNYNRLPDSIPIHYDAGGNVDGFGSKSLIWLLPCIALVSYVIVKFAAQFGKGRSVESLRRMNSGLKNKSDEAVRKITEYNRSQAQWLKLIILILFFYLFWVTLQIAEGYYVKANPWILWGWVILMFVPTIKMVLYQLKEK